MQVMLFLEFIASFLEFFPHEATLTEDKSTCTPLNHLTHTLNTMDWSIQKYYPEIKILF